MDSSSNQKGCGAGVVLESPTGVRLEQSLRFTFKASNNQAEYEALIAGLLLAIDMGVEHLVCLSDSQLTVGQVNDKYHSSTVRGIALHSVSMAVCPVGNGYSRTFSTSIRTKKISHCGH